jgi:hypothetical protein
MHASGRGAARLQLLDEGSVLGRRSALLEHLHDLHTIEP